MAISLTRPNGKSTRWTAASAVPRRTSIWLTCANGQRTKIKDNLSEDRYLQESPGGKYLLYLENDQYWVVDVATRKAVNITKNIKTSFVDHESDETVKQKPPFGVAGWTKNDAEVILYDKFDLWKISADGAHANQAHGWRGRSSAASVRAPGCR